MGTCVSSHKKCCTACFRVSEESNKSTRSIKWFSSKKSIDRIKSGNLDHIQGGNEEKWFDSTARFDSDSEEEFHSVRNVSSRTLLQRPLAGSQFPFSPIEKKVFGSWSHIEPGSFRVRAKNYLRDKKKALSSNYAAYHPFGVDVFLSQRKVDHIARFVQLPLVKLQGEFPPILVVNVQIPLYSPTIFQSENDGEGMSVVLYFKLSENYSKEIASHFLENFRRVINNEVENLKGFAIDAIIPIRERLKILGRVANVDDLQLNAAERKLMHAYNEKPILSRPQHEFYLHSRDVRPRCPSGGVAARAHKRSPHHQPEAAPVDRSNLLCCGLLPHQQEQVSCGFHNKKNLDWVNVMCFENHGMSWDTSATGTHAWLRIRTALVETAASFPAIGSLKANNRDKNLTVLTGG
ncbi:hypothetical protein IFM89_034142 [Coptis chinensis]|uniref:Protein ENHANCED DISEASE RESISTANCE 2 C-terminal domain-containing protein n=1 Tax=Coptis chinensis TaxID=261450 RepID=A0A835M1K7_9MAGN|nr:hypothetical protein IFM89_034142 [Coptis chinensis]